MMRFCEPAIPERYWVNNNTYECKQCGTIFDILFPNGNDLVKFKEVEGYETKWMPSYGKGGYLDLMTKLLPGHSINDEITDKKARMFVKELNKHCEQSENGREFDIDFANQCCTHCGSGETKCISENVLTNPRLAWLKISCDLI